MFLQPIISLAIADYYRRNWLYLALLLTLYFVLSMLCAIRNTDVLIAVFITASTVSLRWMFSYLTAQRAMLSLPVAASQYRQMYWWISFAIPATAFIAITIIAGSIAKLFWSATNFSTLAITLFLGIGGLGANFSRVKRGAFERRQSIWPLLSLGVAITLAPYFIYLLVMFHVVSANKMLPMFLIFAGWYVLSALIYPHLSSENVFGLAPPRKTRQHLLKKKQTIYLKGWWSLVSLKIVNGRPAWFALNVVASGVFLFYLSKFRPIQMSTIVVLVTIMPMTQSKFAIEIARDTRVLPMDATVLAVTLYFISLLPLLIFLPIALFTMPLSSGSFYSGVLLCLTLGGFELPCALWVHEGRASGFISLVFALLIQLFAYLPAGVAAWLLMQRPFPLVVSLVGSIVMIVITCLWTRRQLQVGHSIYRTKIPPAVLQFG